MFDTLFEVWDKYTLTVSPTSRNTHALLCTPGVAFLHPHLERDSSATDDQEYLADKSIFNLENYNEEEEEEFKGVLANMGRQCTGNATNSHDGDTWILSWAHENASASSCLEGYIVVVTISESALRKVCVCVCVCPLDIFVRAIFRGRRSYKGNRP